jgi:sRNA-binding regulator protein Hfq
LRGVTFLAVIVLGGSALLAAPPPKATLLDFAKKKFATRKLTDAEEKLFSFTPEGKEVNKLGKDDKENDPATAADWPDERVIHAECLEWLCTNREASGLVTHRGIQIEGVRIDGDLDLEEAQIAFRLVLWKCAFKGDILLKNARMRSLYLLNCSVKSLNGSGAHFEGSVFLREDCKAEGEVNLSRATIDEDLSCSGAQLTNPTDKALSADGATINGYVFLSHGFKAEGEVNLLGATIGRNLECDGAQLTNLTGKALSADGAKINGDVFLRNGFKAEGEVNLLGATIGGNLECLDAQLTNPKGYAFNAAGAKINGYVFLRNGFKAEGEVNLLGATIGGNLECDGAQLTNPTGKALNAEGAKINSNVFLREGFKADGSVSFVSGEVGGYFIWFNVSPSEKTTLDLRAAKVSTLLDDEDSWPKEGKLFLDGFTYSRIFENSPLTAESRIHWLHRQRHDKFFPQPYEQLASVLRNMGRDGEARDVMIAKSQDHARFTQRFSKEWWWYNALGRSIAYGYQPWNAFWASLLMIALGWVLFRIGYARDLISPSDEKGYAKDAAGQIVLENGRHAFSEDYTKFNAFVYSLESFTPLLKLDQSSEWVPNANRGRHFHIWRLHFTTGGLLRIYLWFHIMAGWVLTSLWVGGITGLVKS